MVLKWVLLADMVHPAGFEPATIRLEGGCSIQLSYGRLLECEPSQALKSGRSGGIRTPDILLPKQTRYRTALHSEVEMLCISSGAHISDAPQVRQR